MSDNTFNNERFGKKLELIKEANDKELLIGGVLYVCKKDGDIIHVFEGSREGCSFGVTFLQSMIIAQLQRAVIMSEMDGFIEQIKAKIESQEAIKN